MKLINDKGKIFGLINIVDLIVLLLIVAVVGAAGYRAVSPKVNAPVEGEGEKYCYVTLYGSTVVPEAAEKLQPGDKLVANNEFTDGEIVSVDMSPAAYVGVDDQGKAVYSEHPMWKDITVVVKEKIDPSDVILKVGNQEVRVNYTYILKTQQFEGNTKVRGIEFRDE